jgi:hypothetical protein
VRAYSWGAARFGIGSVKGASPVIISASRWAADLRGLYHGRPAAAGAWQLQREWLIRDCLDAGGIWDGRTCGPLKVRPILQRDLRRS